MNEVFAKTRELGEAIMRSDEYVTMKAAEDKAMKNDEAAATMGRFLETRQQLEEIMQQDQPDVDLMKELSNQMDAIQAELQGIEDIVKLTEAREDFSRLIAQVNQVLKFIITGEMDSPEESGCGGSCASCGGGCHHHLN